MPTVDDLSILDAILSFGAIVIAPLATKLSHDRRSGRQWAIAIAAAMILGAGMLLSGGVSAAAMAVPWFLATVALFLRSAFQARKLADASLKAITDVAAHMFLVVGSVWAIAACGGYPVLGFDPVIVQLTAIHFHYVGFALPVLTLKAVEVTPGRATNVTLLLILLGVPAVAASIAARSPSAQVVATSILSTGCMLVAVRQFRAAFSIDRSVSRTLLALSAVCLVSGMALASLYAVGQWTGRDWIDIPTMIKTHGLVNAVGFAFCGLMGWRCHSAAIPHCAAWPRRLTRADRL